MTTERFEIQRTINATPEAIFAVLRDPKGHVTIDSSGMLQSSTGAPVNAVDSLRATLGILARTVSELAAGSSPAAVTTSR